MAIISKRRLEAEEKLKSLEKRNVCREFTAGNCSRGTRCKFAHVLPATKQVMMKKNLNALDEPGENHQGGGGGAAGQQDKKDCHHFMAGHCSWGQNCKFSHNVEKYNTRPRSGSAGSQQQGFSRPLKMTPTLGAVMEDPGHQQLPMVPNAEVSKEAVDKEIQLLQEAAKDYKTGQNLMLDQLKEMRVRNILTANDWTTLVEAVKSKRDF